MFMKTLCKHLLLLLALTFNTQIQAMHKTTKAAPNKTPQLIDAWYKKTITAIERKEAKELRRILAEKFPTPNVTPQDAINTLNIKTGTTIFHEAVKYSNVDVVRVLIEFGGDINLAEAVEVIPNFSQTPLTTAVQCHTEASTKEKKLNFEKIVDYLLTKKMFDEDVIKCLCWSSGSLNESLVKIFLARMPACEGSLDILSSLIEQNITKEKEVKGNAAVAPHITQKLKTIHRLLLHTKHLFNLILHNSVSNIPVEQLNHPDFLGNTVLHTMAEVGNLEGISRFSKNKEFFGALNDTGDAPIHVLIKASPVSEASDELDMRYNSCLNLLLTSDPQAITRRTKIGENLEGFTALHTACLQKKTLPACRLMQCDGTRFDAVTKVGEQEITPLSIATKNGFIKVASIGEFMLGDLKAETEKVYAALMTAIEKFDKNEVDKILKEECPKINIDTQKFINKSKPDDGNDDDMSPFEYAIRTSTVQVVQVLVDHGGDLTLSCDDRPWHGLKVTPLVLAIKLHTCKFSEEEFEIEEEKESLEQIIDYLLAKKTFDNEISSCLSIIIENRNISLIKIFLSRMSPHIQIYNIIQKLKTETVNKVNSEKDPIIKQELITILRFLTHALYYFYVAMPVEEKTSIDPLSPEELGNKNFQKNNPLHTMAEIGSPSGVEVLAKSNPEFLGQFNQDGYAPVHVVIQENPCNKKNFNELSIRYGLTLRIFLALNSKEVERRTKKALTPFHLVAARNDPLIAALLMSYNANPDAIAMIDGKQITPRSIAQENGLLSEQGIGNLMFRVTKPKDYLRHLDNQTAQLEVAYTTGVEAWIANERKILNEMSVLQIEESIRRAEETFNATNSLGRICVGVAQARDRKTLEQQTTWAHNQITLRQIPTQEVETRTTMYTEEQTEREELLLTYHKDLIDHMKRCEERCKKLTQENISLEKVAQSPMPMPPPTPKISVSSKASQADTVVADHATQAHIRPNRNTRSIQTEAQAAPTITKPEQADFSLQTDDQPSPTITPQSDYEIREERTFQSDSTWTDSEITETAIQTDQIPNTFHDSIVAWLANSAAQRQEPVLHTAIHFNMPKHVIGYLLDTGHNPFEEYSGYNTFHLAVFHGNVPATEALLIHSTTRSVRRYQGVNLGDTGLCNGLTLLQAAQHYTYESNRRESIEMRVNREYLVRLVGWYANHQR